MARQVRQFNVTIAAGVGTAAAPTKTPVAIPAGMVVTRLELSVPAGPRGQVGLVFAFSGVQVIPFEAGTYLLPEDQTYDWTLDYYPTSGAWEVWTYSTGTFSHTVEVRFHCTLIGDLVAAPPSRTPPITPVTLATPGPPVTTGQTPPLPPIPPAPLTTPPPVANPAPVPVGTPGTLATPIVPPPPVPPAPPVLTQNPYAPPPPPVLPPPPILS